MTIAQVAVFGPRMSATAIGVSGFFSRRRAGAPSVHLWVFVRYRVKLLADASTPTRDDEEKSGAASLTDQRRAWKTVAAVNP